MMGWMIHGLEKRRGLLAGLLGLFFLMIVFPPVSPAQSIDQSQHQKARPREKPVEAPLVPPELIRYIDAVYPDEAFYNGLEAEVTTQIDIDALGNVTNVQVVTPAGHGFDEAAVEAIRQFKFKPAMKGEEPIPSRILYNYQFFIKRVRPEDLPPVQGQAPPAAAPKEPLLSGLVEDEAGARLEGATVVAVSKAGGEPMTVKTDKDGRFSFPDAVPGEYEMEITASGYRSLGATETVLADHVTEVVYRLTLEKKGYETVVHGRKPPREVTRRTIAAEEMTKVPGTGGDALKVVSSLPGVARSPGMSGLLIIRGSSPSDSKVFLDHSNIPMLYHFGGLTSVINSDFIDHIDYVPGNYSVRYGGATGGIVDVYTRDLKNDRFHAYVDADLIDIGALAEGPVSEDIQLGAAVRRSYVDAILGVVLPKIEGFEMTQAPVYWDYQALGQFKLSADDRLKLFAYGSDDSMAMVVGSEITEDPNFHGNVDFHTMFHRVQATWDHEFNKKISNQTMLEGRYNEIEGGFGDLIKFGSDDYGFSLRDELALQGYKGWGFTTGLELNAAWYKYKVKAPQPPIEGMPEKPFDPNAIIETNGKGDNWLDDVGLYTEFETDPVKQLRFIYGLRFDYFKMVDEVNFNPRFVTRYEVIPGTTLKGGVGLFTGQPDGVWVDDKFGNPDIGLTQAIHYGLGAEQRITDFLTVSLEGFYKDLSNVMTSSDAPRMKNGEVVRDDNGDPVSEKLDNEGVGRIYGGELWLKYDPDGLFFGWLSYTLMRSERRDHPGDDWRPFDFDQTHILCVVGSFHLGRGWDVGAKFRLTSGNPYTPATSSIFDSDGDNYYPLYGPTNSARLPLFHQLDVRVDKLWVIDWLKLSVYLDVMNVYYHKNVEGMFYNYDYTEKGYWYGLPILPSIGLKAEY